MVAVLQQLVVGGVPGRSLVQGMLITHATMRRGAGSKQERKWVQSGGAELSGARAAA